MSDNFSAKVIATLQSLRSQSNYIQSQLSGYEILGSASAAEFNAKAYADSLSSNYDFAGSASVAQSAAQSYADTQISNLIDSAPETLNTLNELAAALGDDSNFSTTIVNSLSTKAPLNSPEFTGLVTFTSSVTFLGGAYDQSGHIRSIPQNYKTSEYTLESSDAGKHISITTGGITVPASVFNVGDAISIYNNSGTNQTITQGDGVTLRQAGTTNTGNRTLSQYGICTILCVESNVFAISGAGLT